MEIRAVKALWTAAAVLTLQNAALFGAAESMPQLWTGTYSAEIVPGVNAQTAKRIEEEFKKITEIKSVNVRTWDSSVIFIVRDNSILDASRLTRAMDKAAPGFILVGVRMETSSSSGKAQGSPLNPRNKDLNPGVTGAEAEPRR